VSVVITNPTPQRALRGHLPQRPTPRAATTGEHHARLAGRLTARDRWLARMLHEHTVLTTHQIVEMAFPSVRAANHRLRELYQWRVLDRFQPFVSTGTQPMHYVLDIAGAIALAHEDGIDPAALRYRHDRAIGIAYSLRLAHTVGANGFFTTLIADTRRPGSSGRLTAWWSEARCTRHFGDLVRPDAYGRWHDLTTDVDLEWFLEFDFGTEALTVLASKLAGYEKLAAATGITTPVLVWLPTARREATARRALTETLEGLDRPALVPVATASADLPTNAAGGDHTPAGPWWLPLPGPGPHQPGRWRLADLARAWPAVTPVARAGDRPHNAPSNTTPAELAAPPPCPPRSPRYRIHQGTP
jgi:hypothetical protein